MTKNPTYRSNFDAVLAEHRQLRELVEEIGTALSRPRPSDVALAGMLRTLAESLEDHFEHEERDGYLHEALAAAPRFSALAVRLLEEHEGFLVAVGSIRHAIATAAASGNWTDVADAFADFRRRFDEHESTENRIIQEALLRDVGTED